VSQISRQQISRFLVFGLLCHHTARKLHYYIETMQLRPFEEWIEKGHQRDANLCGACARPTDKRSLVSIRNAISFFCSFFLRKKERKKKHPSFFFLCLFSIGKKKHPSGKKNIP